MENALDIHVKGIVQGVGFRPFVYRLAKRYLIRGWVLNAADGVFIHAEGDERLVDEFVMEIADGAPAAACVKEIEMREVPLEFCEGFEIRFSDQGTVAETTLVSPDLATCDECVRELFDPLDRRFRYPFVNCTNCGPRFTIMERLPYDRAVTSMADFTMCEPCAREYTDPLDRRFHAQPDACFACGPSIELWVREGAGVRAGALAVGASAGAAGAGVDAGAGAARVSDGGWKCVCAHATTREASDAVFAQVIALLCAGGIVAVKGLGGFHLVCDAHNEQAIAQLRARKRREGKAFAVMVRDAESARAFCHVSAVEEAVLAGAQRPIVLLRKRADVALAPGLADALPELGVMLPCTPVQHLLMHDFIEAGGQMLVMTSGNIHDEPIVTDDLRAREAFAGIADAILGNNRAILARYDDSVVRVLNGPDGPALQFVRRARGYSPVPLGLEAHGEPLLAVGPEQKNTFCLVRGKEAFVSQHIGDLENAETFDAWLEATQRYELLFEAQPTRFACDKHPEYLSTKWVRERVTTRVDDCGCGVSSCDNAAACDAAARGDVVARCDNAAARMPVLPVQHHHAHIASVMAEHGLQGPVCGIAFDGTGYGEDGAIWGGEVLLCNMSAFERFANLAYVPMPGGAACVKHPLRMAYGVLWAFDLLSHPAAQAALAPLGDTMDVLESMIDRGINTPYTSSAGRLFDAASALLGLCTEPLYEGEPAILLEAALWAQDAQGVLANATDDASASANAAATATANAAAAAGANTSASATANASAENARSEAEYAAATSSQAAQCGYGIDIVKNEAVAGSTAQDTSVVLLDAAPLFEALLDDLAAGVPTGLIAQRFHDAFVDAIVSMAQLVCSLYDINIVALGGGVFMNRYLVEHALSALAAEGFTVAINRDLPPNDGGISFGQAAIAVQSAANERE